MVTINWKTQLPAHPDPRYIVVEHIHNSASEQEVRDFFSFCGSIQSIEMQPQDKEYNRALVVFEQEDAGKTALLLGDAHIKNVSIVVMPLHAQNADSPPNYEHATRAVDTDYKGKPALYVAHELMAAGYMLGERVLSRASHYDAKYQVSDRTQTQARSLDNQYKFSNYLQQWDDKFKISDRAKVAYDKMQSNPLGKRAIFTVNEAYQSAIQMSNNAREIAERKRAGGEKLFGTIPLPRASSTSSTSSANPGMSRAGTTDRSHDYSGSPAPAQSNEKQQSPGQYPDEKPPLQ
ncbi:Protein vip1 [Coemansia sp. RSA 678]|nr:Protein vip1 [Coemansia sp. RSA 678]